MTSLKWLHISDLHFDSSMAVDSYDLDKVIRPLLRSVEARRKSEGPPDIIFITGDIGNRGVPADYEICRAYLDELIQASGVPRNRVWVVPGNHDVDRSKGRALLRTLENDQDSSTWFFASAANRNSHASKFEAYLNFIRDYFPGRMLAAGDVVHVPEVLEINEIKVGILPLNSAWFSQGDDDRGKLWVGSRLVRERASMLRSGGAQAIIALLHHPLSDLHDSDTAKAWIRNECDVVLRGHLHTANVESVVSDTGSVLEISAGAAYQGSAWPCRAFYATFEGRSRSLTLDPIRYVDDPAASTWVLDVEAFPGRRESGYSAHYTLPKLSELGHTQPGSGFPHSEWIAVSRANWLSAIVDWFSRNYDADPDFTMDQLLHHVAEILKHSGAQPSLGARVSNLGVALMPLLSSTSLADDPTNRSHHTTVLELLAFGINRQLSHLFMLPGVDLTGILEVLDYSRLLLATRQLAAGDYVKASSLAAEIGSSCCVALYVMAQCDRKMELNYEAESKFANLDRLVNRIDESHDSSYPCIASRDLSCLCNRDLLRASLERARGVVARQLGKDAAAEDHFENATRAAQRAMVSLRGEPMIQPAEPSLLSTYDTAPGQVLADVHYSHGYYWYGRGDLERAKYLFNLSINALSETGLAENWDSPYTRLAIVHLLEGDMEAAIESALRARNICKSTPVSANREAPLSFALNTLTLRVIEAINDRGLIARDADPLLDLSVAIRFDPPLALGPLACHRKDATLVMSRTPARMQESVQKFIEQLSQAERDIFPAQLNAG